MRIYTGADELGNIHVTLIDPGVDAFNKLPEDARLRAVSGMIGRAFDSRSAPERMTDADRKVLREIGRAIRARLMKRRDDLTDAAVETPLHRATDALPGSDLECFQSGASECCRLI